MQFLIAVVVALVVGVLLGYVVGAAFAARSVKADVLMWLLRIEHEAREIRTPLAYVELPGYQAAVRRYRVQFDV